MIPFYLPQYMYPLQCCHFVISHPPSSSVNWRSYYTEFSIWKDKPPDHTGCQKFSATTGIAYTLLVNVTLKFKVSLIEWGRITQVLAQHQVKMVKITDILSLLLKRMWQKLLPNVSNIYYISTVLYQKTLHGIWTTDKF